MVLLVVYLGNGIFYPVAVFNFSSNQFFLSIFRSQIEVKSEKRDAPLS